MKIFLASDHAGFELKKVLIDYLKDIGYEVVDKGPYEYDPGDDYPDFISRVAEEVSDNPFEARGIILGGSGQGEAMIANRFPWVRAAVYYGKDKGVILLSRQHNDANILSLGARLIPPAEAMEAVKLWLETPFSAEERHVRRNRKIDQLHSETFDPSEHDAPELPGKSKIEIIPAVMPRSFQDLTGHVKRVRGLVSTVQIDVMDGKFVPETTWPYNNEERVVNFEDVVEERVTLPYWREINYEVDLMVEHPEKIFHAWKRTGVQRIIIHPESVPDMKLRSLLKILRTELVLDGMPAGFGGNVEIGFALKVDEWNDAIYEWIAPAAVIQLMGIKRIGYQGEPFDERVIEKIRDLRSKFSDLIISVDGGVSLETAPRLIEAGANRLVSGSAVFESEHIEETIKRLKQSAL